jgi:hypothetical protein
VLAEFLVAKAVGDPNPLRHAWDNFDVTTPSGTKVEVKSSAYLQSWRQKQLSRITFSGLTGGAWSYDMNAFDTEPTLHADVYVFALHTCWDPDQYDVLDLDAWEFYVVPVATLEAHGSPKSVSKGFIENLGVVAVGFSGLADAVNAAGRVAGGSQSPLRHS